MAGIRGWRVFKLEMSCSVVGYQLEPGSGVNTAIWMGTAVAHCTYVGYMHQGMKG